MSSDNEDPSVDSLSREERETVLEASRLSAVTVYSIVLREGEEELRRPTASLWWSGVAAGIGIATSILGRAVIRSGADPGASYLALVEGLGYSFGFVLVIMSRLQLFTENTLSAVLPLLAEPTRDRFYRTARLWSVVLAANLLGAFVTAAITMHAGVLSAEILESILEISRHLAELSPTTSLLRGIPAGFFIAAVVWMLPSSEGAEVLVIILFTWLIAAGGFTHVVAGSVEIFNLVVLGELGPIRAFTHHILPMLGGNVVGGTGLFAMLAHAQVSEET